jgi:two-component system response regulator MprA
MPVSARVLVARDAGRTSEALELGGFDVVMAREPVDALRVASSEQLDAVVLDIGGPSEEGLHTCRRLRVAALRAPLLALGENDSVDDRIAVLEAGADDYLLKPFAVEELLARLRALMRRAAATGGDVLSFGDLELDPGAHEVRRAGRPIALTPIEFRLLRLLMGNAGRVVDRTTIFMNVWGFDFGPTSNLLNVYVGYLRRKTESAGEERVIHTVRGVGYVLREPAADS